MKILVCGANGFIGQHIVKALRESGHTVVTLARRNSDIQVDFAKLTNARCWPLHLKGIDAVVNAVGVLRDKKRAPMQAIHTEAPIALFEACAKHGVRRVIQVSAHGIEGLDTLYAKSKRAADERLLALTRGGKLDGLVLRPSFVFGKGSEGTELFMALARLPLLVLPQVVIEAKMQPLMVEDLAIAIKDLLSSDKSQNTSHYGQPVTTGLLELAGPKALSLSELILELRARLGKKTPRLWVLPAWLTRLSARIGDQIPVMPYCSDALAMLRQDNVSDMASLDKILGRRPRAC